VTSRSFFNTTRCVLFIRPWSGSFGGPDDGHLVADLTPEGTIPSETFEKGTCRTVEQALDVARRIGYENGIMIKASEGGGGKGIRLVRIRNRFTILPM
jgi:acetyl-CoA carboxylase/biotin carboxylase 1